MKTVFKGTVVCLCGVILAFALLIIFVEIDGRIFATEHDPLIRAIATAWRFDYFFNPLIVALTCSFVAFIEQSKYRILFCFVAVLPFLIAYTFAGSFRGSSILLVCIYAVIALVVSFLFPRNVAHQAKA